MEDTIKAYTKAYIHIFENLTERGLSKQLESVMAHDIHFKDPFNQTQNFLQTLAVFQHMFKQVEHPKFKVFDYALSNNKVYLYWSFHFQLKQKEHAFEGVSLIKFNDAGRVKEHIDFWDPVANIYSDIPIIGRLCRWLTAKLSAS